MWIFTFFKAVLSMMPAPKINFSSSTTTAPAATQRADETYPGYIRNSQKAASKARKWGCLIWVFSPIPSFWKLPENTKLILWPVTIFFFFFCNQSFHTPSEGRSNFLFYSIAYIWVDVSATFQHKKHTMLSNVRDIKLWRSVWQHLATFL